MYINCCGYHICIWVFRNKLKKKSIYNIKMINSKNLEQDILKSRPTLKKSTIDTYITLLERLKKIFKTDNYEFLASPSEFMKKREIADAHYLTQRNMLNAIIVLLMALNEDNKYELLIKRYGDLRDALNEKYDNQQKSGVISEKQAENFATSDEIFGMLDRMKKDLKDIDKEKVTKKELQLLQAYTLFSVYARMPMRNDLAGMNAILKKTYDSYSDEKKKENNYLVVGSRNLNKPNFTFILNDYKTNRKYGTLELPIEDKQLKSVLKRFLMINETLYKPTVEAPLFKTSSGKPINRNELSKILLKYSELYLNKKISTTLLRKIFLSSKYGGEGGLKEQLEELAKDNKVMGHSKDVALNSYIKKAQSS
jgi:hypothetical protein